MTKQPFRTHSGIAAPYARDNVDTDAIIPAVAWREAGTDLSKLADYLFYDARFDANGKEVPEFVLNRPPYRRATVLVAGDNFGCGSSREHAPWALLAFGVRVVVASSFGDIFYNNCFKNGLLPVRLDPTALAQLRGSVAQSDGKQPVSVDLEACAVVGPDGSRFTFEVDAVGREMLLEGVDEIGLTLRHRAEIDAFQARQRQVRPWIYEAGFTAKAALALCIAFGMAVGALLGTSATAQEYPTKPVRIIVPAVPGGSADASARTIADRLGARLGQAVIVENKAGAGGVIATQFVAQAAPDGYTVMMAFDGTVVVQPAVTKVPFDTVKDFVAITKVSDAPLIIATHPGVPVKTLAELVAHSKTRPGGIAYGTAGTGTTPHLAGELLALRTGAKLTHIPYKGGGQALTDTLSGATPAIFTAVVTAIPHIQAGKLVPIAVGSPMRVPAVPTVPTFGEAGVTGMDFGAWFGLMAPAKTPRAVVDRLHRDVVAVLQTPEVRDRFAALGLIPGGNTPEQFAEDVKRDLARWTDVVAQAKIKIE